MQMTSLGSTPPNKNKTRSKSCISPRHNKKRRVRSKPLDSTIARRNLEEEDDKSKSKKTTTVEKTMARRKIADEEEEELDETRIAAVGSYEEYILSCQEVELVASVGSYEEYILSRQEMHMAGLSC